MTSLVALALLPPLVLGSPPPSTHRVSALLIPMDRGAETRTLRFERYMNEALGTSPRIVLKRSDDLFGAPLDEPGKSALERAAASYREGKAAWERSHYEEAGRKLRAALSEYQKAASALRDTRGYCETLAMYAATMLLRKNTGEARSTLLDLVSIHPTYELQPERYPKELIALRAQQVATSRDASLRGNLLVKSRPGGARVYLDGDFRGYTPIPLDTLQVGKHLLRIERPGFRQYGRFVEVTSEDQEVVAELHPTPGYRAYDAVLDEVAAEVGRERAGPPMLSLGKMLNLDRAIVGVVREFGANGATELIAGYYDLRSGQRLAAKRVVFQGEEYGQVESEVARLVNRLLVTAEGGERRQVKGPDPLESRHGTEEWGRDDQGGQGAQKARGGGPTDPLDAIDGTEGW